MRILPLIPVLLALAGCAKKPETGGQTARAEAAPADPDLIAVDAALEKRIRIGRPELRQIASELEVSARVEVDATRTSRIGSPVLGRVTEVRVEEGQDVHEGQLLAVLYSTGLNEAQLDFLKALSQRMVAERAVARAKTLLAADVTRRGGAATARGGAGPGHRRTGSGPRGAGAARNAAAGDCRAGKDAGAEIGGLGDGEPRRYALLGPARRCRAGGAARRTRCSRSPTCARCGWWPMCRRRRCRTCGQGGRCRSASVRCRGREFRGEIFAFRELRWSTRGARTVTVRVVFSPTRRSC